MSSNKQGSADLDANLSPSNAYLVSRSACDDGYEVWNFDPEGTELMTRRKTKKAAQFNRAHHLIQLGGYLLEWGPLTLDPEYPCYPYRLFEFDPTFRDPLGAAPLMQGAWPKSKFTGTRADFGNADGAKKKFAEGADLLLIPFHNYLLNFVPSPGRGTFRLWNFNPFKPTPYQAHAADPLVAFTPRGAFETIQSGSELLPIGNYALERVAATAEYRVWSFDPEQKIPLKRPTLSEGVWEDMGEDHQLVVIGEHILDWQPSTRAYRLWGFDPQAENPLVGPLRGGKLPKDFNGDTTLTAVLPRIPVSRKRAKQPGTVDFMRSKIKHVVYYMVENRSLDHVCGWLYENGDDHVHFIGGDQPYDGASTCYSNPGPDGKRVHLSKYKGGKVSNDWKLELLGYDPYHDNSDAMRQMFHDPNDGYTRGETPNMQGFVWNNGDDAVMETYTPEQLPVLNGLAEKFAISDEWFCSMPGGTDVNRAFSLTGSSMNMLNNFQNGAEYEYWPKGWHRPSIWKTLWSNGMTDFKLYHSVEWMNFIFSYHLFLDGQIPALDAEPTNYLGSFDDFLSEAKDGKLPAFSFIEPIWIAMAGTSSYHPGGDLIPGERQLNQLYNALRESDKWDETLLVITFDEHGGIFDHVPPPYAQKPWPNDVNDGFNYDILGPRIPTILVSPWIKKNTVFRSETQTKYDSTSILATILEWQGIPRSRWGLGDRTESAPTFEGVLQRSKARKKAPKFTPPFDAMYPRAEDGGDLPITEEQAVHGLHELMMPRLLHALSGGKLTAKQSAKVAQEILDSSNTLHELHAKVKRYEQRLNDV